MPFFLIISLLIFIGIVTLFLVANYHKLIRYKNKIDEVWPEIEAQMKRRQDLVPVLLQAVRAHARYEQQILDAIDGARSQATQAKDPRDKFLAETNLTASLQNVFGLAGNYPELVADANFMSARAEIIDAETGIENAQRLYNIGVKNFNEAQEIFPTNLVARLFNFKKLEYLKIR